MTPTTPDDQKACEQAAILVLDCLPHYIADTAKELAYVHNRQPLWAFVAGHILRAYENGELAVPIMDPGWPRHFANVPDPLNGRYKCKWCGAEFAPHRYKQQYCQNSCGTAAQHLEDEAKAESTGKGPR